MSSITPRALAAQGVVYAILTSLLGFVPPLWSAEDSIWTRIGPDGGNVSCIVLDPLAPSTIYAGTRGGGVFKSIDKGGSWTAVNSGLTDFKIGGIAVDPMNAGTVYASSSNAGLFKSTNGGQSWTVINTGLPGFYTEVPTIDPTNTDTLYAGTGGAGIYKSTDGGEHWTAANVGLPEGATITALALDGRNSGTLYAGTDFDGVFKTEDGGLTWTAVDTGLPGFRGLDALTIDPQDPTVLYAGIYYSGSSGSEIWKTTNGGDRWNPVAGVGLPKFSVVTTLVIDPNNPKTIYVVGYLNSGSTVTGIYKSGDGGDTWTALSLVPDSEIPVLAIDFENSSTIYAGSRAVGPSGSGMYKSTDGGKTWVHSSRGLSAVGVYGLTVDHSTPGTLYAGTDLGVFKSADSGTTWSLKLSNIATPVLIDPSNPSTIYVTTNSGTGGDVLKSTDGGETWRRLTAIKSVASLAIDPNNPKTLYGGISDSPFGGGCFCVPGVLRTDDGGETWRPANAGLPSGPDTFGVVAVDPKNSATIYTAITNSYSRDIGVYRSTDGGGNWKQINSEVSITAMALDKQHAGVIYAATAGKGLLKSVDGGDSWIQIGNELKDKHINALAVEGSASFLYAGTQDGNVLRSTDAGASWIQLSNGPPMPEVHALAIDPENLQTVYAGTLGGVFKLVPLKSAYQVAVPALGANATSTAGLAGPVQSGYATVTVDSASIASGVAVFSFRQHSVLASETGVPPSPPTKAARVFVEYRTGIAPPGPNETGLLNIYTGIALTNPSSSNANVTYTLRNVSGTVVAVGHGSLAAGAHFARFVNQLTDEAPDFRLPVDFPTNAQFGSLDIASDQPVSVLALRLTVNQRNEALLTTTPTADLTQLLGSSGLYFPHFVNGGGYVTRLILLNTSNAPEAGTVSFYDGAGQPLIVGQAGGSGSSSFTYSIQPGGVFLFQSDGTPSNVNEGSVQLTPNAGTWTPAGAGVFSVSNNGILVSESGIPAAEPTTHARIYVDLSGGHDTGLAIANTTNTNAVITLTAFQSDGVTAVGTSKGQLQLPARGHSAHFVDEFIAGLPAGFTGMLDIYCPSNPFLSTPFAALTLRSLVNERRDFLLTTFPVDNMAMPAQTPIIFPQIADGDGYTTQFILLGAVGASNATIQFWNDSGIPLAIGKP